MLTKLLKGLIKPYAIEKELGVGIPSIYIRRQFYQDKFSTTFGNIPYQNYQHYDNVNNKACENVIGYMPVPLGMAGPLKITHGDGITKNRLAPMATTEGALLASVIRGCKVLNSSGGVNAIAIDKGMTRSPLLEFNNIIEARKFIIWLETNEHIIEKTFNSTTNYGKYTGYHILQNGRFIHLRLSAICGDALGMNMISKATEAVVSELKSSFKNLRVLSVSSNACTDKKNNTINSILGRSKHVVVEANIPHKIIEKVLHCNPEELEKLHIQKNLYGSGLAGGTATSFNAHAANMIAAMFIAQGQDIAQVITSAACTMHMENTNDNLYISTTMPQMELATLGGGTDLPPQKSVLKIMEILEEEEPTLRLAETCASYVMAGELSLLAGLLSGDLVSAHMAYNRKKNN